MEHKTIATITVITGTESAGDVNGEFFGGDLKEHIIAFGKEQLLRTLTGMRHQVFLTAMEVDKERKDSNNNPPCQHNCL